MTFDHPVGVRAGFWRRFFAVIIDLIIVLLPFQLLVAVLFTATSGHVQMTNGVGVQHCSKPLRQYDGLVPPPPVDSSAVQDCSIYFFGVPTARALVVGRVTQEGRRGNLVARAYLLDRDGRLIDAVSVDWIALLTLIVYWLMMEAATGATLGNRWTRTRVVNALEPKARRVPLSKVIIRHLMMWTGAVPLLVVYIVYGLRYRLDLDSMAQGGLFQWLYLAGSLAFIWLIFICVQIAGKRDPIYDSIAGTAVVQVAPGDDREGVVSTVT
jgi:uncharacterized RDD family membrane protein YckC